MTDLEQPRDAPEKVSPPASVDAPKESAQVNSSSSLSDPLNISDPAISQSPGAPVTVQTEITTENVTSAGQADGSSYLPQDVATPGAQKGQAVERNGQGSVTTTTNGTSTMQPESNGNVKLETPESAPSSNRGRGNSRGRPRGRGRGGGSGRGSKRKREANDDDSSSDSEVYSPMATMTKSGRSIQKPTSYIPPPVAEPSPVHATKRKRTYRRNPDSAVCKVCLRGTSPASNQIVFCDGCNSPYHQFCHHPPIAQDVITELDKEWFCKACERERIVPDHQIAGYVAAPGALDAEGKRQYFNSLDKGLLVTLLTKATTMHPDLPLFDPEFVGQLRIPGVSQSTIQSNNGISLQTPVPPPAVATANVGASGYDRQSREVNTDDHRSDHPPNYPRPGQGLMTRLPPESQDVSWMVDDHNSVGVFSHFHKA